MSYERWNAEAPKRIRGKCGCGVQYERDPRAVHPELCTACAHRAEKLEQPPPRVTLPPAVVVADESPRLRRIGGRRG
jgi:hypothetical protein